jgi:hypothetical protein
VKKHGAGKWRLIQKDATLSKILHQRSNVDLKVRERIAPRVRAFSRGAPGASSQNARSVRISGRPPRSPARSRPPPPPPGPAQDKWRNMYPSQYAGGKDESVRRAPSNAHPNRTSASGRNPKAKNQRATPRLDPSSKSRAHLDLGSPP